MNNFKQIKYIEIINKYTINVGLKHNKQAKIVLNNSNVF